MWLPIRIDEQRPEPLYHQIEVQLRGLILGGQLEEGTLLPSLRELAISLKCSAITVRRVYQDLENEGLIRTRQGTGTFVAGVATIAKDEHRLERATEELERAVDAALQLHCKIEELEDIFQTIIQRKAAERKGDIT
ncbi:GntR family transcriptional regulator [Cohnella abietis]|uniref:GntR family transcriptional regulator n=1 Tax=Cohnella abietis TaxID=2507935 RepID=A0A3T1D085_9BACL|nr:GntR family transcriptional regulator [Cohnella abietis]BBI31513.1 GntR family transcriptional regulator [Cohnella abietis]